MAFQKLKQNVRYMGADKSPFIPRTPAALAAFKTEVAEVRQRRLAGEVSRKLELVKAKKIHQESGEANPLPELKFMNGRKFVDNFSLVFSPDMCLNIGADDEGRSSWPTLAEMRDDCHRRATRERRCFPPPKRSNDAPMAPKMALMSAENSDNPGRWAERADIFKRYVPATEIALRELTPFMRNLISDIDQAGDGEIDEGNTGGLQKLDEAKGEEPESQDKDA
jgi:hypothetical protein